MRASKSKKLAKAKADKYFSLFIRQRDSINGVATCITCGKMTSQFDCGHFISRDREAVRYDEKNSHAQCVSCNRFKSGRQYEHGLFIDKKYGEGTAEKLLQKSRMLSRRRQSDYEWIAKEYKNKLKELV